MISPGDCQLMQDMVPCVAWKDLTVSIIFSTEPDAEDWGGYQAARDHEVEHAGVVDGIGVRVAKP